MSNGKSPLSWTMIYWEHLSEHSSQLVRHWVANNARIYLHDDSRKGLIRILLDDREPLIQEKAKKDILQHPRSDMMQRYLDIAVSSEASDDQVMDALCILAQFEDTDGLMAWLHEISAQMSQDSRSYVHSLLALPEYLTQMSLAQAAPVAERLFEIIRDRKSTRLNSSHYS